MRNSEAKKSPTLYLADHERWYAAVGYISFLCFLSMWKGRESSFVRFHARQAFLLFFAECVSFVLLVIIDKTLGRLPFLGLFIVIVLQIGVYLLSLFLSVAGFVKALFGELWEMPFFGQHSERVPMI